MTIIIVMMLMMMTMTMTKVMMMTMLTQLGDGTTLGAEDAGAPPLPLPTPLPLALPLARAGGVPGAELPQTLAAEGVGARQQHRLLEQFQTDGAGQLLRHARGDGHVTSRHVTPPLHTYNSPPALTQ